NTLAGQPLPAEPMLVYTANVSKGETAWAMLEQLAGSMSLPSSLTGAIAKAKQEYYAPDLSATRTNMLKKLIAGQPAGMNADQWGEIIVPKLATLLRVADAALDVAKEHAAGQQSAATWQLVLQLAMLAAAGAFGVAMMLLGSPRAMMLWWSRRVVMPLQRIQGAMLKLADGDFGVAVPGLERKDEVGAMANAVERFKAVADEKARREADVATQRQQAEAAVQAKANEERARTAEERARTAEEQAHAFRALADGSSS